MVIAALLIDSRAAEKLARRTIDTADVHQLTSNRAVVIHNPHPRAHGSKLLIGETHGGRPLTVVIEPDRDDRAIWHVRTAWQATEREGRQLDRYR